MNDFLNTYTNSAFGELVLNWIINHGVSIAIALFVAIIGKKFLSRGVEKMIRSIIKRGSGSKEAEEKRENTLIQVINGSLSVLIWVAVALIILSELGIAIGPLLAAAGVAGIAIGFGGQYIIRDIITGLLLLLEEQYRVGDIVCFGTTCGVVENITLRKTTLRDLEGTVHHVPHGGVDRVSNKSKAFARVNITIGVAYDTDIEKVSTVVNEVGSALAEEEEWKDRVRTAPQFLRIDDFADSAVVIRILGETKAGAQWEVAGELRKRLKKAFDKEGIEIPFPQRVIHQTVSKPKTKSKK
ncbi:mechanosensitive ion channel family protein [Candidatus Kaiserbacteria bacterium CG10_big_fil_rev_8_21_14_0_10_45_20]|uniref:Mechanosensitive ion channel family protein n=1 Tax=Candidatus Kaiserbacteria bacterium CG10_big_fil_rev_8_21_14_0_10_45_20 TaxID=1974607 RepID=A0A2H0UEX8_9BACT|nr:MAG: mechanosensitive ion channel family protein [Candidatus Kaiserbacteria bacterium CG10_big_fil_rev_8_21_14_0_10_45_20]